MPRISPSTLKKRIEEKPNGKYKFRRGNPPPIHHAGRPPKAIDWTLVESLCEIQCTMAETAAVVGVSTETLSLRMRQETGFTWSEFFHMYSGKGKAALRRLQWTSAKKSVDMQKFLGINHLGQSYDPTKVGQAPVLNALVEQLDKLEIVDPDNYEAE